MKPFTEFEQKISSEKYWTVRSTGSSFGPAKLKIPEMELLGGQMDSQTWPTLQLEINSGTFC